MSDWKDRLERIKSANEGTYKQATQPRKPKAGLKNHPSRTHSKNHRGDSKKTTTTISPLCDMCGKKIARRNIVKVHDQIRLCKHCNKAKEK